MTKSDWLWDWRAQKYDVQVQEDEGISKAAERMSEFLKADDVVLDYGCGTGIVTFKIALEVKSVLGIDTSVRMIELAKKKAHEGEVANVRFSRNTIFDDGLAEVSYDVVLAFNILHLLEDAQKAVNRSFELLKPGGLLVSLTPCLGDAGLILRSLLPLSSTFKLLSYLRSFRTEDMNDMMSNHGFDSIESEVHGGTIPSYFIVARKACRPMSANEEVDKETTV